ncbi:nucleotidyltransferase family protein [Croceicoccus gelatinilyticus]|uniref:nucleotidyltransferase family protein n=1 Tax=Croceicoccus gelatinilyticus TaxID=2835536 RepID=UPI001BCF08A6|nr:nucleotidyltransferase family protein [Croceicoccus gelatinilyticus]
MTDPSEIACILLAAGEGRRFGGGKLLAPLDDRPLGLHAADMLKAIPFGAHVAVAGPHAPDFAAAGFEVVTPEATVPALSASIAEGVGAIAGRGFAGVLIALADMPHVPAAHLHTLIAKFEGEPVATLVDGRPQPPALFGARHFVELCGLSGDRGAQALLRHAQTVELSPAEAFDVDTQADLENLKSAKHRGKAS